MKTINNVKSNSTDIFIPILTSKLRQIMNSMECIGNELLHFTEVKLFFLLPDWKKLNHLKSRMECGFQTLLCKLGSGLF